MSFTSTYIIHLQLIVIAITEQMIADNTYFTAILENSYILSLQKN